MRVKAWSVFATIAMVLLVASLPAGVTGAKPEYSETPGRAMVSAANITATISRSGPVVTFQPAAGGASYEFRYSRLLAFNDTGDGMYQSREITYFANLTGPAWELTHISEETVGQGRIVTVRLAATLDMTQKPGTPGGRGRAGGTGDPPPSGNGTGDQNNTGAQNTTGGNGTGGQNATSGNGTGGQNGSGGEPNLVHNAFRITFTFTIAERDMGYGPGGTLVLRGGSEMKIDISLVPSSRIPSTHLALEQALMYSGQEFNVYGASGRETARSNVVETAGGQELMHTFQDTASSQQRIAFAPAGKEGGFLTWIPTMESKVTSGMLSLAVGTSYRTDGTALKVYHSFQLRPDSSEMLVDPTVGVIPQSLPPGPVRDTMETIYSHGWSIFAGVLVGTVIASAAVASKRVAGRDPVDLVRLEKNPY